MIKKILLVLLGWTLLMGPAFAQVKSAEEEKFSGFFPGINFARFANQIESSTDYRFYFDLSEVENIQVNINAKDNTLSQILEVVFENSNLKFVIDGKKRVFITKGSKLDFALAKDFFQIGEKGEQTDSLQGNDELKRAFTRNKLYVIGSPEKSNSATTATLTGKITGLETGNPVFGAVIFEKVNYSRAIANEQGIYSFTLPKGRHTLFVQNLGGFVEQRQINLQGDGSLDMAIEENIISLSEVVVSSEKLTNVSRPEMGVQSLSMNTMRKLPAVLGEVDILKGLLTLPGVNTVGEASVGFNVRGGAADQNLILYNNTTIYNPAHLFGLFSAFNPDMIESVDLYKAGVPVKYGGRLSSVLNVNAKYGSKEKLKASGGIGLMTGRLTLEGPIGDKTTFIIGGRSTYSNWLFDLLEEKTDFREGRASFYDLNFNMEHRLNDKNIIRLNSYMSKDNFRFDQDTLFGYQNQNINLSWTHYFSERLEGEFVIGQDRYKFGIEGRDNPLNAYDFGFDIQQDHLRADFVFEKDLKHTLNFGFSSIRYGLRPGYIDPFGSASIVNQEKVSPEQALETALYFGDDFEINDRISVNYGLRYVIYNSLGPNTLKTYQPGQAISESTVIGEKSYDKGEIMNTYHGPEFRISGRYNLDKFSSIKAGYNTMRQHIHLLTNSSSISPTDTWKLSDPNIRPQWGDQISLGYYRNLKANTYEFSLEVYHRSMKNLIDYRSGASLVLNNDIEQDILRTDGRAYGAEMMLKKNSGKLNGWISYTYSRSLLRTAEDETAEKINGGEYYPSNFDQPHNIVLVGNYELSKRVGAAVNANYSTGRPVTLPVAKFVYGGSERVFFSDRNAYRIPDYFRVDLSMNLEGNHKVRKLAHSSWSLGVYNVLGRKNPYSVFFTPVNGVLKGYQLSIFAQPIPFVTYNFRF
ncbi:TonB-dependent receptor [Rhodonellum sp.]|uniref:TonB-dependent receptor n=1 Tax=Rhodonellum sp. TaxID=2231180 RepID=UPI002720DA0C|nr:TonB-dependent receptor [Rhodonellum sp.]MDO9551732.1 TonB-dependent receptor [Rhodonellum sp.]